MEKQKIMIVDDQPAICTSVTGMLKFDYTVFPFTSGKDALDFLKTNTIDLILLDYEMPGMTGYEVLINIRMHQNTKATPVVFLTGATNERMRQEMMGRGATDYLTKPVDPDALKNCIKKYLP